MKTALAALAAASACLFASPAAAQTSIASWYGPGLYGHGLACPGAGRLWPWTNGVANLWLPCGTRLEVCFRGRCARTRVVDRGPYVAGRDFDLAAGLARRLGFAGVAPIQWRIRRGV